MPNIAPTYDFFGPKAAMTFTLGSIEHDPLKSHESKKGVDHLHADLHLSSILILEHWCLSRLTIAFDILSSFRFLNSAITILRRVDSESF